MPTPFFFTSLLLVFLVCGNLNANFALRFEESVVFCPRYAAVVEEMHCGHWYIDVYFSLWNHFLAEILNVFVEWFDTGALVIILPFSFYATSICHANTIFPLHTVPFVLNWIFLSFCCAFLGLSYSFVQRCKHFDIGGGKNRTSLFSC